MTGLREVELGIRSYVALLDDTEAAGEASDGRAALDRLARANADGALPDVVLLDLLMERMDGITATAAIKERYPEVEVVAMTDSASPLGATIGSAWLRSDAFD